MRLNVAVLLCILLLSACSNNNTHMPTNTPTHSLTPIEIKSTNHPTHEPEINKSLFTPVSKYNESDIVKIELNNEVLETKFFKHRFEPFGFYIPSNMEAKHYEDGVAWELTDSYGTINIDWYNNDVEKFTLINENLTQFSEYVSSEKNYDSMHDYFVFDQNNRKYQITVRYLENEKEKILPLLLKVIENIRYTEETQQ